MLCLLCVSAALPVTGQTTAFTYQGHLTASGAPANGQFDLRFSVHDALTGGNQIGLALLVAPASVTNGVFTATLDFGSGIFTGAARWLEIAVRTNGGGLPHVSLRPRQAITATPYAIQAASLSGTLPDSQLSANVARLNGSNGFSGAVVFNPPAGEEPFRVNTTKKVTNLNADQLDGRNSSDFVLKAGDTMTGPLNLPANGLVVGNNQLVVGGGTVGIGTDEDGPFGYGASIIVENIDSNGNGGASAVRLMRGGATRWAWVNDVDGNAADNLTLWQAGALKRLTVTTTGNVGIGTTSPSGKLEIVDNVGTAYDSTAPQIGANTLVIGNQYYTPNLNSFAQIALRVSGDSGASYARIVAIEPNQAESDLAFVLRDGSGHNERLRIKGINGNVGIGTNGPKSALHVKSTGDYVAEFENPLADVNAWIKIVNDSRAYLVGVRGDTSDGFSIYDTVAGNRILIDTSGNVGIGTTTPAAKLDVAGSIRRTGVTYPALWREEIISGDARSGNTLISQLSQNYVMNAVVNNPNSRFRWYNAAGAPLDSVDLTTLTPLMVMDASGNVTALSFTPTSDRNVKEHFAAVAGRDVLERLARVPIQTWNYTNDTAKTRHIGPMAQDFHAAFGVGADDKHIATVDADGVALAAIQGLHEIVREKETEIESLKTRMAALERLMTSLLEKREVAAK